MLRRAVLVGAEISLPQELERVAGFNIPQTALERAVLQHDERFGIEVRLVIVARVFDVEQPVVKPYLVSVRN